MANLKLGLALLVLTLVLMGTFVLAWMPCTVESRQYVATPDGGYTEEPCTLQTSLWAKVLWDAGTDLYYTPETGLSLPGSF